MITFKTKKRTLGLKDGHVYIDGEICESLYFAKISAHEGNGLIKAYKNSYTKVNSIVDRDKLFKTISNLEADYDALVSLKELNVSTWKLKEDFRIEASAHIVKRMEDILPADLSKPELAILKQLTDSKIGELPGSYDLLDLYNVEKDDLSKIEAISEEFRSYDYAKFNIDGEHVYNEYKRNALNETLNTIDAFRELDRDAGNDLVNWSQHKITRRLNSYGIQANSWRVSELVRRKVKILKNKGIKKDTTPKKLSKAQIIQDKVMKGGIQSLNEEEKVAYFKKSSGDVSSIITSLKYETILELIDSPLKTVQNKFSDKTSSGWNRNKKENCGAVVEVLCGGLTPEHDTKTFNRVIKFVTDNNLVTSLSWEFLVRHSDRIPTSLVSAFADSSRTISENDLSDKFFDKHLKNLNPTVKFRLNETVTYEFLRRMDNKGKAQWLEKFGEIDACISRDIVNQVYKDVPWNDIKDTIKADHRLRSLAIILISKNQDKELAAIFLNENSEDTYTRKLCYDVFKTFDEKFERMTEAKECEESRGRSYYNRGLEVEEIISIFGRENLLKLMERMLTDAPVTFDDTISDILNHVVEDSGYKIRDFLDVVEQNISNLQNITLSSSLTEKISLELRKKIVSNHIQLSTNYRNYYYSRNNFGVKDVDEVTKEFFSIFKREDVTEVWDSIYESPYKIYLGHVMTREELATLGNNDRFLRYNLEHYSYGFLKKYKDKELFKEIVGDRRDHRNKSFGEALLKKLEVTNAVDFFASL